MKNALAYYNAGVVAVSKLKSRRIGSRLSLKKTECKSNRRVSLTSKVMYKKSQDGATPRAVSAKSSFEYLLAKKCQIFRPCSKYLRLVGHVSAHFCWFKKNKPVSATAEQLLLWTEQENNIQVPR
jgi:hypothetical protein